MNLRHVIRTVVAVLLTLGGVFAHAGAAGAHSGVQTYLYLDVSETSLGGRLEIPVRDLRDVLDLEGTDTEDDVELTAALVASQDEIAGYLAEHFTIGVGAATWPVDFGEPSLFFSDAAEQDDNYTIVPFTVDVGADSVPRRLDVTLDPFVDEIGGRDALLLIANDWEGGVIDNGHEILMDFTASSRTQVVDLGDTSWFKTFTASLKLGVDHIKTGPDHILFVLVLLLPAVLVFRTGWHPATRFGSSLWRVTKVVTMFTVAHTITFSLAGLEVLPLPPARLTESIIAASIGAAALHNLRPIAVNREWLIAFVFGLFHGMGFASLVEGLDVSRSTQLISLAGRNIGIELAQTAVVVMTFPALFLLRRTRYYVPAMIGGSLALAAISVGWLIERAFAVDLSVSSIVEPLVAFPRALVGIVVLTVIAALVERTERRAGRLKTTADAVERREPELVS